MRQNQANKRYGVIDIGSNSIRMMLFDYNRKAQPFANVKKYLRSTRLGHGVDASGNLAGTSVARSIDALGEFKGIADAEEQLLKAADFFPQIQQRGDSKRSCDSPYTAVLHLSEAGVARPQREGNCCHVWQRRWP